MKKELISVIIPVYNVKKYLKKCLESVVSQTYSNLEIILVDDGSTDGSEKICDEYAIQYNNVSVIHKKNGGLSSARNAGINVAKGKYIGFIDSDDFVDKRMYEILYKNLIKEQADISICNIYKFRDYNEVDNTIEKEKIETFEGIDIQKSLQNNYFVMVVAWNKLYKKELFKKTRYPNGKIIEDAAIIHYLLDDSKKIVVSNLELYYYYQRDDSIMHNSNEKLLDELDALYDRIKFYEKKHYQCYDFYNYTLKKYIEKFWNLFKDIHKYRRYNSKIYRKYFIYLNEILYKVKELSKKEKIKYYLFCRFKYFFLIFCFVLKAIRKVYRKITSTSYNIMDNILCNKKYKKYFKNNSKKYILFNTPDHGNLGDHAIFLGEAQLLKDKGINFIEIIARQTDNFIKKYRNKIGKNDIIMITGGGNFGTLWEKEQNRVNKILSEFNENRIIIFPQTIFYSNDIYGVNRLKIDKEVYKKCENLLICCRDKKSYNFANSVLKVNCKYTPDIATYLNFSNYNFKRKNILFCFRKDKEKIVDKDTIDKIEKLLSEKYKNDKVIYVSTVEKGKFTTKKGVRRLIKFLKKVAKSKLFITDRLHGMIFAAITGTPCIAMANSSGKVKGVFEWISKENKYVYFAESYEDIQKIMQKIGLDKKYKYNNKELKKLLNEIM